MAAMIDPSLFEQLRVKIEEDTVIRKELDKIIDELVQHVSFTQGVLSRIHSTPRAKCSYTKMPLKYNAGRAYPADHGTDSALLTPVEDSIKKEIQSVGTLAAFASQYPYFK